MKCSICGEEIEELPLGKIKGTYLYYKGKLYPVCSKCQSIYRTKEKMLELILGGAHGQASKGVKEENEEQAKETS